MENNNKKKNNNSSTLHKGKQRDKTLDLEKKKEGISEILITILWLEN